MLLELQATDFVCVVVYMEGRRREVEGIKDERILAVEAVDNIIARAA